MTDVWRDRNPGIVGTTWETRGKEKKDRNSKKIVKTRIDRWLVQQELVEQGRIGEVEIERTTISDHDIVTCQLRIEDIKKRNSFDKISPQVLNDTDYTEEVKRIFEEETTPEGDILERHETFKERSKEAGLRVMKKWKKKKKRDKYKQQKKIKLMRRIVQWLEDARIKKERGKRIKRWERGNRMLREAKAEAWLGKKMSEVEVEEVHKKAEEHLRTLIRKRDEGDEREKRLKKNLEKMKQIDEDERGTKYFYQRVRMENKRETIEGLIREPDSEDEQEEEKKEGEDEETKDPEKMKEIAKNFYERLWRKRKTSHRRQEELLKGITRKISEEEKEQCEGNITEEEVAAMKKKMAKGKAAGIDGLPVEFWQEFDYMNKWLSEVFNETRKRKQMTTTMKLAVVKILYKKGDRNRMSHYRPISLLCADYIQVVSKNSDK